MQQIGRFVVQREIARGGQGAVYDAWDPTQQRRVAIKLLRTDRASRNGKQRMLREGQALTQLHHPGLVPCLEVGEFDGAIYLVLGFVEGTSLGERMRTEGGLPLAQALRIADDLAGILAYVHARGLIHRDLKPDNVLLSPSGQLVLADFGLAKLLGHSDDQQSLTQTGAALGTPGYWAPEQAHGDKEQVGPPADVYGWAATVYAVVCGEAPRTASSLQELIDGLELPPPPLRQRRGDAPAWLETLLAEALTVDPHARPSLAEVQLQLAAGLSAPARSAAGGRLALAASALLVVGLIAGLIWVVSGGEAESPASSAVSPPDPAEQSQPPSVPPPPALQAVEPPPPAVEKQLVGATPYFQLARDHLLAGRLAEARDTASEGLSVRADVTLYAVRAKANQRLKDYAAALADYDRYLSARPTARVHVERGWLRDTVEDFDGVERDVQAALALEPGFPLALALRAHLQIDHLDQAAQGVTAYEQLVASGRADAKSVIELGRAYALQGRHTEVVALHRRTAEVTGENAKASAQLGTALLLLGELSEARVALTRAIGLEPLAAIYLVRAQVNSQLGETEAAVRDCTAAYEAGKVAALLLRGQLHDVLGRDAECTADFEQILREGTQDLTLLRDLVASSMEARPELALRALDALAGQRDPQTGEPVSALYLHAMRANAYRKLHDHPAALREVDGALKLMHDANLHFARGEVLLELERYLDAEQAFARSSELDPESFSAISLRATALTLADRGKQAIDVIQLSRDPRTAGKIAWVIGRDALYQGDPESALPVLERAVKLTEGDADSLVDRGRVKLALGDTEGARADLIAAVEVAPDNARAWLTAARMFKGTGESARRINSAKRYLELRPWGRNRPEAEALAAGE